MFEFRGRGGPALVVWTGTLNLHFCLLVRHDAHERMILVRFVGGLFCRRGGDWDRDCDCDLGSCLELVPSPGSDAAWAGVSIFHPGVVEEGDGVRGVGYPAAAYGKVLYACVKWS